MITTGTVATIAPGRAVMELLGNGVPLSLLLDLINGPCSADLLANERPTVPVQRAVDG